MGKLLSKYTRSNSKNRKNDSIVDESIMKSLSYSRPSFERKINDFFAFENVLYANVGSNDTCVFGDSEHKLTIFDYNKGKIIHQLVGHQNDITKTLYCRKIDAYLSASRDKSIKLWKTGSNQCLNTMTGHELVVSAVGVDSKNNHAISGSRDNYINLWDLNTGKSLSKANISRNLITDVYWSFDDKLLIQSSEDKEIRLWDPYNLKLIFSFPKKQYIQTSCHLTNDGNYALSTSNGFQGNGCEITLWDLRKRALVQEFYGHIQTVSHARFTQNDKIIASVSHDSTLRLWDITSAKQIQSEIHIPGTLTSVNEAKDGTLIITNLNSGIYVVK